MPPGMGSSWPTRIPSRRLSNNSAPGSMASAPWFTRSSRVKHFGENEMADSRHTRRTFLRATGVGLALPLLESFAPLVKGAPPATPRRMIAVCAGLGLCPDYLFPAQSGRNYTLTPYLNVLKDYRDSLTVCSGLSHPDVGGGHEAEVCFLTAAPRPGQASFRNTISLDQFAVEKLNPDTRFSSLVLGTHSSSISFNRGGVQIPPDTRPSVLFSKLFLQGKRE